MLACLYSVGLRQLLRVQDVSTQENNLPDFDADKRHLLTEIAEVFNVLAL